MDIKLAATMLGVTHQGESSFRMAALKVARYEK